MEEKQLVSGSDNDILGSRTKHQLKHSRTSPRQFRVVSSEDNETDGSSTSTSQKVPEHLGVNVCHLSNGPVAHEDIPEFVPKTMEWNINESTDLYQQIRETICMVVDTSQQPQKRQSAQCSFTAGNNHIRCQYSRMGSPLSGSCGTGTFFFFLPQGIVSNILELRAAFQALLAFSSFLTRRIVLLRMDNTVAVNSNRWHQGQHTHEESLSYPRLSSDTSGRPESSIHPSSTEPTCRRSKQNIHLEQQMVPESSSLFS